MAIQISERHDARFFNSRHFIAYSLGDGLYTIVRSGILLLPNESHGEASAAGRPWNPEGFKGRAHRTGAGKLSLWCSTSGRR